MHPDIQILRLGLAVIISRILIIKQLKGCELVHMIIISLYIRFFRTSRVLIILFLLFSLNLTSCSKQNEDELKNTQKLVFNIDSSSIGKIYIDSLLSIQFNPPINWDPVPQRILDTIRNTASKSTGENLSYFPVQIFADSSRRSFVNISRIDFRNELEVEEKLKEIDLAIVSTLDTLNLVKGKFIHNDQEFVQYLFTNEEIVHFKLVLIHNFKNLVQFDYIISKQIYESRIKSIESSIASIKQLN